MKVVDGRWAPEVVDVMYTVELALIFNRGRNKDSIVRRTCNNIKHRMTPDIKLILHHWAKSNKPFEMYTKFMDEAGL